MKKIFVLILLLIFSNFMWLYFYNDLKSKMLFQEKIIENLTKEKENLLSNIQSLKEELNEKNFEIEEYKERISKLEKYKEELERTQKNKKLRKKWILENLKYDFSKTNFINDILNTCISDKINFPCMVYLLKEKYGFSYETEVKDVLKGVEEFISDKKGDCEDWSLFVLSLLDYIRNKTRKNVILTCKENKGYKFFLYKIDNTEYYLKDCKELEIDLDDLRGNMICYEEDTYGHCIIGFSKENLDPSNLDLDVYLFEPQNGIYLGKLKDLNKEITIILNREDIYLKKWEFWK